MTTSKKTRRPFARRRVDGQLLQALTIRVDDAVYLALKNLRVDADKSFNDTLRRLLGL